jgi:Uma2 family endonuclease
MTIVPKSRLSVVQFLDWAQSQPDGRYELVEGRIVAMAPERVRHNRAKAQAWRALDDAIQRAKLSCTAFTDGMTVVIDEATAREPDAAVQCGTDLDPDATVLPAPVIVLEVISPSTERDDSAHKLADYFTVASIHHYLILNPVKQSVVHHQRGKGGAIATRIVTTEPIVLDPPGFSVDAAELFPR